MEKHSFDADQNNPNNIPLAAPVMTITRHHHYHVTMPTWQAIPGLNHARFIA
jgi:hypothetical protein